MSFLELTLGGGAGRYRRRVSSAWAFADDRIFGGHTSGLALVAAADAIGMPHLVSCHVLFTGATRVGTVEIHTGEVVRGRTSGSVTATVLQRGEPTLKLQALFASERPTGPVERRPPAGSGPDGRPPLTFRTDTLPFMELFEERAIDYPESEALFHSGSPIVELWSRPRSPFGAADVLMDQIVDLMILDAHLLESALRGRVDPAVRTASLDLGVWWSATPLSSGWRRVRAESRGHGAGFPVATGSIHTEEGGLRAWGTTVGREMRPGDRPVAKAGTVRGLAPGGVAPPVR
jgi:acyl-CoA thioesterase-2